jgi:CheY-like chemotaxis protein
MPKMNGIEFLGELRKDPNLRRISVFVLTTSDDDRDKVAAYDYNVAGYILKPVESPAFIEAVSTLGMYWSLIEMP